MKPFSNPVQSFITQTSDAYFNQRYDAWGIRQIIIENFNSSIWPDLKNRT